MEAEARNQRLYEQLGAPTLVYRHAPSYTSWDVPPAKPWMIKKRTKIDESKYIQRNCMALNRARARWYYSVDHPFRQHKPKNKATNRLYKDDDDDDDEEEEEEEEEGKKEKETRLKSNNTRNGRAMRKEFELSDGHCGNDSGDGSGFDNEQGLSLKDSRRAIRGIINANPIYETRLAKARNPLTQDVETAREQHLTATVPDAKWVLQSRKVFDQNYIPGQIQVPGQMKVQSLSSWIPPSRQKKSFVLAQERKSAAPAYLAIPSIQSIRYASGPEDFREKQTTRTREARTVNPTKDDPYEYGNCISCFACRCRGCTSLSTANAQQISDSDHSSYEEAKTTNLCPRSVCLVHPTGELLSKVTVSNLILPRGPKNKAQIVTKSLHEKRKKLPRRRPRNDLDVDEPIRQIEQCGSWNQCAADDLNFPEQWHVGPVGNFVARSQNYCTLLIVQNISELTSQNMSGNDNTKIVTESSSSGTAGNTADQCSGLYNVKEIARVDLRSIYRSQTSYTPTHVTCHPNYGGNFSDPTFVILSPSSIGELNTLHHVTVRDTVLAHRHTINCLKTISDVDFTSSNPMVLWSAAKSYVRPGLKRKYMFDRPMLGHGHSLYTIDLRSDTAVFQWSPSAEEKVPEGVHSISSMKTDWHKDHTVWVTSASAGKTWEIDGRMQCSAVNTWSLAEACNDMGAALPRTGLNGSGVLLTQPLLHRHGNNLKSVPQNWSPIVTVSKDPGKFGFTIHQRPEFSPRFQTKPLECVSAPGIGSQSAAQVTSICSNSVYALPDVSDNIFTCGIASFSTDVSGLLPPESIAQLGYEQKPKNALCVVTMTNKGDIYSHTLLESNSNAPSRAKQFPDLPVGSSGVPLPKSASQSRPGRNAYQKKYGGMNLYVELSNIAPIPSEAILPQTVAKKKECRPFATVRLEQLPTHKWVEGASTAKKNEKIEIELSDKVEKNKQNVETQLSDSSDSSHSSASSGSNEQHAQADAKAPGIDSSKEARVQKDTESAYTKKMVSVELGVGDIGSVLTNSNKRERASSISAVNKEVKLPSQHVKTVYGQLGVLADCFLRQEGKLTDENGQSGTNLEERIISDVDRGVFEATEKLWNDQVRVEDYVAAKKDENLLDEDAHD